MAKNPITKKGLFAELESIRYLATLEVLAMRKWVYRIIRNTLALVGILVILEETFGFVGEETRCRPPERITDAIDNTESVLVFPFILPALGFVNAFKLVEKIKKKLKDLVREADRQAWHRVHEARSA